METVTVSVNGAHGGTQSRGDDGTVGHGITQGEILRQEQEAGIVPVPAQIPNGRVTRSGAATTRAVAGGAGHAESGVLTSSSSSSEEMEPVHARGPDVIGMADMGPQAPGSGLAGGIDLEGALGRRGEGETMATAATVGRMVAAEEEEEEEEEKEREGKEEKDEIKDSDGDTTVADADGVADGDGRAVDGSAENRGPDAVDSTTL